MMDTFFFLAPLFCIALVFCSVPFLLYVVFPFLQSFSPERKFERFLDEQCILGNEIAILIRREGSRYYRDNDYALIRAAINGNDHAIRALKLDQETLKKKFY